MKRILFVIVAYLSLCSFMPFDPEVAAGSFEALNGKSANLEIVFDKIHGRTEAEFAEYEKDWKVDKPEVESLTLIEANKALKGTCRLSDGKERIRNYFKLIWQRWHVRHKVESYQGWCQEHRQESRHSAEEIYEYVIPISTRENLYRHNDKKGISVPCHFVLQHWYVCTECRGFWKWTQARFPWYSRIRL